MYEDLRVALRDVVSPERLWVLLEAYQLLSEIGQEGHEFELQQVFGLQDGVSDTHLFVSRVEEVLTVGLGAMLRQYGVYCAPNATMVTMTALLNTLGLVESYIIPQHLMDVIEGDFTREEVVSELVPYFSDHTADEILEVLEEVRPATITRLGQIVSDNLNRQPPDVDLPAGHTEKVRCINRLLWATNGEHPSLVKSMAASGFAMGYPLPDLITKELDALDEMGTDVVAVELLGLICYSDVPLSELEKIGEAAIADFTDDRQEQVRMKSAFKQWMTKL